MVQFYFKHLKSAEKKNAVKHCGHSFKRYSIVSYQNFKFFGVYIADH